MFEGHDTTSAGITWVCHLLGNYPEVQRKALEEIEMVIGDAHEISYEHLSQLKYCECVIKESLRLYPSVPIFARVLGDDQEVSGHVIPKGTQILVNPYLIHRDPSHWDNPEEFRPERYASINLHISIIVVSDSFQKTVSGVMLLPLFLSLLVVVTVLGKDLRLWKKRPCLLLSSAISRLRVSKEETNKNSPVN